MSKIKRTKDRDIVVDSPSISVSRKTYDNIVEGALKEGNEKHKKVIINFGHRKGVYDFSK